MAIHRLVLFSDHFQFYLQDDNSDAGLDGVAWTKEASRRKLAVGKFGFAVGTARYGGDVRVTVEIQEAPPVEDLADWDQVNECSLEVPSGRIVIAGCTNCFMEAARLPVKPGVYRARVYYGDLVVEDEEDEDRDDHYRIVLWPTALIEPRVLKQWVQPDKPA